VVGLTERGHTDHVQTSPGELIGRRAELAWLRERLRLAAQGAPQCVLLSGEAGIGKTRLALEVCDDARAAGFATMIGRCYDGVLLPFLPFRDEIFPTIVQLRGAESGDADALTVALGESTHAWSSESWEHAAPSALLIDLAKLLLDTAARRPMLLFLDDLQWADSSSIALVSHVVYRLAGGLGATHLLLLLASRPSPVIAPVRREHHCAVIELAGLDEIETADLAQRAGTAYVAPRTIWEQTGGNPLLIEAMAQQGQQPVAPPALQHAFDAQFDALSEKSRDVLRYAALLVPDLSVDTLVGVGRWDEPAVHDAVDEAIVAGVLAGDAMQLRFVHPLMRTRSLQGMGPLARARAHAELAHALGPADGGTLLSVARHLVLAGREADADELADVTTAAGHRAMALCAWEEAAGFFEGALAAQGRRAHPASAHARAELHVAAGECRRFGLDVERGMRHFEEAATFSRDAGDLAGETRARIERLVCLVAAGPLAPGEIEAVETLVDRLGSTDPALAADALVDISQAQWATGRLEQARSTIERALAIAEPGELHATAGKAHVSRAITDWITLDLDDALDHLRRADAFVRRVPDPTRRIGPTYRLPLTLLWLGRLAEAEAAIAVAAELSEEMRSLYEYGLALAAHAQLSLLRGQLVAAEEDADRAIRIQRLSGYRWAVGLLLPALAIARLERDDASGAATALATWDETADDLERVTIDLLRLLVAVRSGRAGAEAIDQLPPLARVPLIGAQDWAIITIEIARTVGETKPLAHALDLIEATIGRRMVVSNSLAVLLARVAADGHALLGRTNEARQRYAEAIVFADANGADVEGALARVGLANLEADNSPSTAVHVLRSALPALEQHSLTRSLRDATRLAERLGMSTGAVQLPVEKPTADNATVLFVDVVESTRLTEELGDEEYRRKARSLERKLRLTVAEHDGTAMPGINLGDGLVALFPKPTAALDAAFGAIRAGADGDLRLHVGVHQGRVLRERDAVYGSAVNVAARICAMSSPDEVLVSESLHRSLRAEAVPGLAFVDRGRQRLKGVASPQRLFAALPAT
jgi:class 3 adenylate cyclase